MPYSPRHPARVILRRAYQGCYYLAGVLVTGIAAGTFIIDLEGAIVAPVAVTALLFAVLGVLIEILESTI